MIRLATYQGPVSEGNMPANLARVREYYEIAHQNKADFVCFPECYLTGYFHAAATKNAFALDAPIIAELCNMTRNGPVLLVGAAVLDGGCKNAQLVFDDGKLLGYQSKTMLCRPGADADTYVTDRNLPVFTARGVTFGICICHTTSYVEPALLLRLRGARLLFTPHYNSLPPLHESGPDTITYAGHRDMVLNNQAALATLLKMVVVRSNILHLAPDAIGSGDAGVWAMDGHILAMGRPFVEELVYADVPANIFAREHWIDHREVPMYLYDDLRQAAADYLGDTPFPIEDVL